MRDFIRDNFNPDDRLVVACKDRDGRFRQHFVPAKLLAEPLCLQWLKSQNDKGANIYIGMNALNPDARQRTKRDVAVVRHVYLDIDHNGDDVLRRIAADGKTPEPSYVVKTSPGKYQMLWKVENFGAAETEALNRGMAAKYGADPAAIDVSRALRFPGFFNHKYNPPCMVTAKRFSDRIYTPSDFGVERLYEYSGNTIRREKHGDSGVDTPSHRDWREVRKRLEAGENPAVVQADLAAAARSRGKSNPEKYAETTIRKAQAKNAIETKNREAWIAARRAARNMPDISEQKHISNQEDILKKTEKPNKGIPEPAQEQKPKIYLHSDDVTTREAIFRSFREIKEIHEPDANGTNVKAFTFDRNKGEWFTTSQTALEKAKAIIAEKLNDPAFQAEMKEKAAKKEQSKEYQTPEKSHIIGTLPAGMAEEIKAMSIAAKKLGEAGILWNDKQGWNTTNEKLAEAVHRRILEKQPRFYLEGDTFKVKDQLAAIKDENEKHIAFYDRYKNAWYALSEKNRNLIQAEIDIPPTVPRREKLYLEPADRIEREAIFLCKGELKEILETNENGKELKTFSFNESVGKWYTYSPTAFERAKSIVAAQMSDPDFQAEMAEKGFAKENGNEPHQKIPLKIDGIPSIEVRKQMKDKGCYLDENKIWVAPNEKIAKEVQAIIDAALKRGNASSPTLKAELPLEAKLPLDAKKAEHNTDTSGMGD